MTSTAKVANAPIDIPIAQLPSKPFVLSPRVTGSFASNRFTSYVLNTGSALSHDSPAVREGLEEIECIDIATEELTHRLHPGFGAQSSPIADHCQTLERSDEFSKVFCVKCRGITLLILKCVSSVFVSHVLGSSALCFTLTNSQVCGF